MKKAQVETIGLVVIVALLAFIFIFVLQIQTKPDDNSLNTRYLQLNADNLRSVILKTNICSNVDIRKEIIGCNNFQETTCTNINCNELNDIIEIIIENSLNITKNYKFEAGNILVEKNFDNCKDVYAAASEPIPNSDIKVKLEIC